MMRVLRIFVVIVAIAAVIAIAGPFILEQFFTNCDTTLCCNDCEYVDVIRVIDGDTFDSSIGRIRLYGVDTPEIGEPCAAEATEELTTLVGERVRVEEGPRPEDSFNRLLRYAYNEDGESIEELMISKGLGHAWREDGHHMKLLVRIEGVAAGSDAGCLWSS